MVDDLAAITEQARLVRRRLPTTILPYWLEHSRDDEHGGFLLPDDVVRSAARRVSRRVLRGRIPPVSHKQLVTQSRLVWLFAHAHVHGYDQSGRARRAAADGASFLVDHFLDREHGGYAWMTDAAGNVTNPVNHLYGLAFTIFGFVELSRATGDDGPLTRALDLHRAVERHLHDDRFGGWREHAEPDWSAVADDDPRILVPFPGRKSGNGVVHWMEALVELTDATGDEAARESLRESLERCRDVLYPADPAAAPEPCFPDWSPDLDQQLPVSYGHNVEFAWLMVHAQEVLGEPVDWDRFHRYVDHALAEGYDEARGGMFTFAEGRGDATAGGHQPASRRHKLSWVQCEMVNALTLALTRSPAEFDRARYEHALAGTLRFTEDHLTDRRDGIHLESVQEDGARRWPKKSGDWKVGYHEVRAAVKLVDAFA